ncbi:hypothetical protein BKA70DRAFT_479272 [Coprinopsis sp. MPI-PUGE-AT-0042]|nr:hypothetical protein BKA70DRAFT_479272 [Coprinopsis sp. MPI-PUGE-AT-0042]
MSPVIQPDRDPNPFHDALAIHKHRDCLKCGAFKRNENFKRLLRCGGCGIAMYCSKQCQESHWPIHKAECKAAKAQNKHIEAKTGITNGYTDYIQWIEYYATPIKNCVVAAFNLPQFPHQERDSALGIVITHKGDSTLPLEHRFNVKSISRFNRGDTDDPLTTSFVLEPLDSDEFKTNIQRGKAELGREYYGTAMFMVIGQFPGSEMVSLPYVKIFSIDKTVASARVVSGPWWTPLRQIMESGGKMRFCCSKLGTGRDCCCGGWVHHVEGGDGP